MRAAREARLFFLIQPMICISLRIFINYLGEDLDSAVWEFNLADSCQCDDRGKSNRFSIFGRGLVFAYFNVNSLLPHINELRVFISSSKVDILVIKETLMPWAKVDLYFDPDDMRREWKELFLSYVTKHKPLKLMGTSFLTLLMGT